MVSRLKRAFTSEKMNADKADDKKPVAKAKPKSKSKKAKPKDKKGSPSRLTQLKRALSWKAPVQDAPVEEDEEADQFSVTGASSKPLEPQALFVEAAEKPSEVDEEADRLRKELRQSLKPEDDSLAWADLKAPEEASETKKLKEAGPTAVALLLEKPKEGIYAHQAETKFHKELDRAIKKEEKKERRAEAHALSPEAQAAKDLKEQEERVKQYLLDGQAPLAGMTRLSGHGGYDDEVDADDRILRAFTEKDIKKQEASDLAKAMKDDSPKPKRSPKRSPVASPAPSPKGERRRSQLAAAVAALEDPVLEGPHAESHIAPAPSPGAGRKARLSQMASPHISPHGSPRHH